MPVLYYLIFALHEKIEHLLANLIIIFVQKFMDLLKKIQVTQSILSNISLIKINVDKLLTVPDR